MALIPYQPIAIPRALLTCARAHRIYGPRLQLLYYLTISEHWLYIRGIARIDLFTARTLQSQ